MQLLGPLRRALAVHSKNMLQRYKGLNEFGKTLGAEYKGKWISVVVKMARYIYERFDG